MKINVISILFLALSFTLLNIDQTRATTILELSFDQVCQGAELIFEGRVVSKETRPSHTGSKPFTYFTFKIIEVIKGSYTDSTIEIGFMGGQSGDSTLKVYGMQMPEIGERGIYFVENLSVQQVHPLCGWQQGHCLVISDKQTGQDVVILVEDKDSMQKSSWRLTHAPALEVFKQNIRNMIEKDK
jgi:hypothetical protein